MYTKPIDWKGRVVACTALVALGVVLFSLIRNSSPLPPVLAYRSILELGPHEFGTTATARIVLANYGDGELVVGPFKTSCSCAGVEVAREGKFNRIQKMRISPHSKSEIVVRITVGAKPGSSQQVTVLFSSNDPAQPEGLFEVHIPQVLGGVFAMPSAAIFGEAVQGSADVREVYIYANGAMSRKIESVRVSHPERFEVELIAPQSGVHEPQVHETAGQIIAVARVRPKSGYIGRFDGYFELTLAGESRLPDRVDVIGQILGPYSCTPEVLSLPRYVGGTPTYQTVFVIACRDGKPITVTADGLPNGIEAKIEKDANDSARVLISCDSAAQSADLNTRLRFKIRSGTNAPESLEVPLLVTRRSP